jgi:hypothetical protein
MNGKNFYRKNVYLLKKILGTFLTIIFFLKMSNGKAQSYEQQSRHLFAYNVLLNGCIGGIGGAINKSKNEKFITAFTRNFLKGSLGGAIMYEAKYMVYPLRHEENYWMAPLLRAGYYAGYSFTYNASLNKSLLDSYHCQYYLFNFDIPITGKNKVVTRISLTSTLSATTMFLIGNKLDLSNSLKYGVLYFDQNPKFDKQRDGFSLSNCIEVMSKTEKDFTNQKRNTTIAHEMVHTFQFADYFSITNTFYPSIRNLKTKKIYPLKKYIFVDVPYFAVLYTLPTPLRKNLFEFEAYHFERREVITNKSHF